MGAEKNKPTVHHAEFKIQLDSRGSLGVDSTQACLVRGNSFSAERRANWTEPETGLAKYERLMKTSQGGYRPEGGP